jgi:hypothetical protein
MRRLLTGAALALATCLSASAASATILTITYSGSVNQGDDETGVFGLAGQSLVGQTFTAKFVVDTAKPGALHQTDVWYDMFYGNGAASPVSGALTINGVTETFGSYYGYDNRFDHSLQPGCDPSICNDANFTQGAQNFDQQLEEEAGNYVRYFQTAFLSAGGNSSDGTVHGIAHVPVNYSGPPVTLGGFAEIYDYSEILGENSKTTIRKATAYLLVTSVTTQNLTPGLDLPSAAPEPSAWALMITGFGMAGTTLRRRNRALARG